MGVQNGGLKWGLSCDAGKNPFIKNHALAASLVSRFFRCDVEVDTAAIYLAGVKIVQNLSSGHMGTYIGWPIKL
jgi:hypothetical protein